MHEDPCRLVRNVQCSSLGCPLGMRACTRVLYTISYRAISYRLHDRRIPNVGVGPVEFQLKWIGVQTSEWLDRLRRRTRWRRRRHCSGATCCRRQTGHQWRPSNATRGRQSTTDIEDCCACTAANTRTSATRSASAFITRPPRQLPNVAARSNLQG